MIKFFVIIFLLIAFLENAIGQKPKARKNKTIIAKSNISNKKNTKNYATIIKLPKDSTNILNLVFGKDIFKNIKKPIGYTNDFEHVLTSDQINILDKIIGKHEKETTNQIAIITIDSTWTTKDKFNALILELHNYWGVGVTGKNNGILIGISKGFRKIRISNGYGIEPKITDSETKEIIDHLMIPEFKKGNYFGGVKSALFALMEKIK